MDSDRRTTGATGIGLATIADTGQVLDTWFHRLSLSSEISSSGTTGLSAEEVAREFGPQGGQAVRRDLRRDVNIVAVRTRIKHLDDAVLDVHDAYLRLHLLSHRLIRPREASFEGLVPLLPMVAWTSIGPCLPERADAAHWASRRTGFEFSVKGTFKVPKMLDYVVPRGVAISNADRVMLGAYLAPGTTMAPEGFCSINAGTLGPTMVEGRISAGVVVGEGTDIGGGASIMGTYSGGGKQVITIGRNCLLGANSGVGISLGDNCVVEAGCYITAGAVVTLNSGDAVKAVELSGRPNFLFRRNSRTGQLEALEGKARWPGLNPMLHHNE
ncbi:DapH/DapD/GlmU-related protein [Rhizobium sp. BK251]|uniref:DapH/DapD/GlmU-related protein n=1 Tax=Rhizobium sp. BK251 TaxID=2512125 RepID=UPI00104E7BE6|nr:DapH/DapD/GlmU-related protein [Rhizobium sp. BK251]TCL75992.1 2,3,4,5-tetrahydropyridine-2-carboxylate N-succinyltransferase [Rhizobium sp. BK251]